VLSALSRNAMVMSQQNRSATQGGGSGSGGSSPRTPLSIVPVPYRNSKLTHLLKGMKVHRGVQSDFCLCVDCCRQCSYLLGGRTYYLKWDCNARPVEYLAALPYIMNRARTNFIVALYVAEMTLSYLPTQPIHFNTITPL
jgi:hypothetical protein